MTCWEGRESVGVGKGTLVGGTAQEKDLHLEASVHGKDLWRGRVSRPTASRAQRVPGLYASNPSLLHLLPPAPQTAAPGSFRVKSKFLLLTWFP